MENVNKKGKLRGKKFVWFERMLRREGRKLCAVALCASMIIGNMAWPAAAANDTSGEYSFELSSESLFIAIQDAIAEGTVVDTELDLKGSAAEEYQELLEAGGNLYEIEPVIDNADSDRDKVLDLRAYVRLENDIELDSAYVMDGAEEVTFLLVNSSDVYQQATISVDGRESETITVLPAGAVAVDEEEAGPGVTGTVTNSYTNVTGSISKSSSGSGGGGSNDISTDVEDNTQTNGTETINTNTDNAENVDIVIENERIGDSNDETGSIIEVQIEANTDNYAQDPEESKSSTKEQQEITDLYGTDNNTTGTQNEMGDTQGENEEDSNLETDSDPIDDNTTSNSGVADGDIADGESEDGVDQTSGPENSDVTDDSGSEAAEDDVERGTDESGNNNTTDEQDSDTGTGDETDDEDEEVGSDETYASAISVHTTYLLAATATSSDAEEATPSDAYGLNGQTYETVLISGEAAVAYVTEAEELQLDKIETLTYTAELDDVVISVEAPVGALPWGVKLKASEYEKDSETYLSRYEEAVELNEKWDEEAEEDYTERFRLFNIGFYDADGIEVEPAEKVIVTITCLDEETEDIGQVIHFGEETEIIDVESGYDEDGNKNATYELESFSDNGIMLTAGPWEDKDDKYYVDHIDVGVTVTATLVINGEEITERVTLGTSDFTSKTVTLTAEDSKGNTITDFNMDLSDLESSTGSDGTSQVRVGGSYYIGTADNPVYYTFTLTKDVTFTAEDGTEYTVTMTFTATFSYWDEDNNCPGLTYDKDGNITYSSRAGMDFVLTSSTANRSLVQIYKYVYDENGKLITGSDVDGKTYTFTIYDSSGKAVETATVTVGSGGIGYYSTDVTAGSYYLVETNYASAVGDKNYNQTDTSATYTPSSGEASTGTSSTTTTATMTVNSNGTTIYTINNYYVPSTTSITITKKVTGNMGDKTKEFTFTLTNSDGELVGTDGNGNALSETDNDGETYSFTLADGESVTVYGLTINDIVYLLETDADDYKITVEDNEGKTINSTSSGYAITVGSGVTITVENYKETDVDNGITLDSVPYLLLLSLAVIPSAFLLFRRRSQWF